MFYQRIGQHILAVGYYLPRATPEQAKALRDKAVKDLEKNEAGTLKAINALQGGFLQDDLYVFVVDLDTGRYVAHGTGAWWAARYLSEKQPAQVQKFVMVAAQTPVGRQPDLQQLVPALKLATADVFYQDSALASKLALERGQASKRLKNDNYKQVSLKTIPGNSAAAQEQLYRRIRGWLSPQNSAS